jgi:catechol 2,3-dioxygenase-like lactoylglutathione lyase family enzyme
MARVTGIGGVFFRSKNPRALEDWYEKHLGLPRDEDGYFVIWWGDGSKGSTVWAPFPDDTSYFGEDVSTDFMSNYRVDDLEAMLADLSAAGVRVSDERIEDANGHFGWAWDPEGHKIELWQPNPGM